MNDLISIINQNKEFEYINTTQHYEILGYQNDELLGNNILNYIYHKDVDLFNKSFRKCIEIGKIVQELRFIGKKGEITRVKLKGKTITNTTGSKSILLISSRITDLAKFPSENPNPILRVTKESVIYSNNAGENLFGIRKGDIVPEFLKDEVNEAILTRTTKPKELKLSDRIYSLIITPIKNEKYANIYGRDITERKRTEEKIRNQAKLIEIISDAIIPTDSNFNIIGWNRGAEQIYGWKRSEIIGKNVPEILKTSLLNETVDEAGEKLMEEGYWEGETIQERKDGKKIFVLNATSLICDDNGNPIGFVGVNRDITERKKVEQKLKESEARFKSLYDNALVAMYSVSLDGQPIAINDLGLSLLGYSSKEEFYSKFNSFNHWADPIARIKLMEELKQKGEIYNFQAQALTTRGEKKWTEFSLKLFPERGQLDAIAIDITKRKETERELQQIEWLLTSKKASEALYEPPYGNLVNLNKNGILLNFVGHEFLLDIVNDYLELLETSAAIYEKNGDYALGIFSSGWCQFLDKTSRGLCGTENNLKALNSGKWVCHESCWSQASKIATETGQPVDIECDGGIHIYTVPIFAGSEIVGSINFGYGDPPKDPKKLKEIAEKFKVNEVELHNLANSYESRPPFIIDIAKKRLNTSAKLIGSIVEQKQTELRLRESEHKLKERFKELICLYGISKLIEKHDASIEEIINGTLRLIRPAWQYPTLCCTRIIFGGKKYVTMNFKETEWKLHSQIKIHDKNLEIEVFYLENKPFLKEEELLINDIGNRLKSIIEHKEAELDLKDLNQKLKSKVVERTQELRNSEKKFRVLFNNSTNGIAYHKVVYDTSGNPIDYIITDVNPQYEKILSFKKDNVVNRKATEIYGVEIAPYIEQFSNVAATQESTSFETYFEPMEKHFNLSVISQKIGEFITVFDDISKRKRSEQKLIESEEKFRTISEQSVVGISIIQDNQLKYINQCLLDLLGYTRDEVEKWSPGLFINLIHLDYRKRAIEITSKNQSGEAKTPVHEELKLIKKTGEIFWVGFFARSIIYNGKPAGMYIIIDITERKAAEQKLKESEEKFRNITEQSLMGICIAQDNKIKYINEAYTDVFGYTTEEMMSWGLNDAFTTIHPDDRKFALEQLSKKQEGEDDIVVNYQYRGIKKSGDIVWVDQFSKPVIFEGKPADFVTLINITDRKVAEEKLKESEEKFRTITEQSFMAIAIMQDNKNVYVNETLQTLTEYSIQEMLNWSAADLFNIIHPDDRDIAIKRNMELFEGKTTDYIPHSYRLITKSGKIKRIEVFSKTLYFQGKSTIFSTLIDITEKKIAEEKLKESEERLHLIFDGSHDLITISDENAKPFWVNPAWESIFGPLSEYKDDPLQLIHPGDIEKIGIAWNALITTEKQIKNFQYRYRMTNGEFRNFETSAFVIILENEKKYCTIARDVTERNKAEIALRESEYKYRSLFENMLDGFAYCKIITDENNEPVDFKYLEVNDSFEKLTGLKKVETEGRRVTEIIPDIKGSEPNLFEIYGKVALTGETTKFEIFFEPLKMWLSISVHSPEKGYFVAVFDNITERKKADMEIRLQSEIMTNVAEGVYLIRTNDLKILWANSRFDEMFGYNPGELMGQQVTIVNDPTEKTPEETAEDIVGVLERTGEWHGEVKNIKKDGTRFWCYANVSIFNHPEHGEVLIAVHTDITERKVAEQKLKDSEEKIRNLVNNISDVLFEANGYGDITFLSHQIFDIIGYQPYELIGLNFAKLMHPEDIITYKESLKKAQDSNEPISIECRVKHKKGYYIPISVKGSIVESDKKFKIFGVIRDISERKRVDEMKKKEIKKLREIDKIKSDLVRRISHELNTPLISIFSGAQYLLNYQSGELSDNTRNIIKIIFSGGNRLKDMVDNLTIAYDIESESIIMDFKRENVIPIIRNCIDNIILDAEKRSIFLNVELLDNLYLNIDKLNFTRAIINILSNAVKNTPANGNIFIKTFEHHNYVDIIIKDTGVGLTKKEIPLLFEKFGKIERYGKGLDVDIEGPGLGLYISKEIVKLHNGDIMVKSKGRNKGSTFTIRLFLNKYQGN